MKIVDANEMNNDKTFNVRLGMREAVYLHIVLGLCTCGGKTPGKLGYDIWEELGKYIQRQTGLTRVEWENISLELVEDAVLLTSEHLVLISRKDRQKFYDDLIEKIQNITNARQNP